MERLIKTELIAMTDIFFKRGFVVLLDHSMRPALFLIWVNDLNVRCLDNIKAQMRIFLPNNLRALLPLALYTTPIQGLHMPPIAARCVLQLHTQRELIYVGPGPVFQTRDILCNWILNRWAI